MLALASEPYGPSAGSSVSGLSTSLAWGSEVGDDSSRRAMLARSSCALNPLRILGTSRSAARESSIRLANEWDRRKSMISRFISSLEILVLTS